MHKPRIRDLFVDESVGVDVEFPGVEADQEQGRLPAASNVEIRSGSRIEPAEITDSHRGMKAFALMYQRLYSGKKITRRSLCTLASIGDGERFGRCNQLEAAVKRELGYSLKSKSVRQFARLLRAYPTDLQLP